MGGEVADNCRARADRAVGAGDWGQRGGATGRLMTRDDDFWELYLLIEERGLAEARRDYLERFKVAHSDKSLDAEIEKHFSEAVGDHNQTEVTLPAKLV